MKKRKWYLRVLAAVLAFGMIAVLFIFVVSFTGNPISKYIHEKEIYEYVDKTYPKWKDTFISESRGYNFKDGSYTVLFTDKKQPYLQFIVSSNGNHYIYDSYETDYIEGFQAFTSLGIEMKEEIKQETFTYFFFKPMHTLQEYPKEVKEAFLKNQNVKQLPLFYVSATIDVKEMEIDTYVDAFQKAYDIIQKYEFPITEYEIDFQNKDTMITISGVKNTMIEDGSLKAKIEYLLENEKSSTMEKEEKYVSKDGLWFVKYE